MGLLSKLQQVETTITVLWAFVKFSKSPMIYLSPIEIIASLTTTQQNEKPMKNYFFKFFDISDSANEALGNVERTAAIIQRSTYGAFTIEVALFNVNFYFDDWKSDEILAADRFNTTIAHEVYSGEFWNDFALTPRDEAPTAEDEETMCYRLIEYANLTKHEWKSESFHESHPLYVSIDL